MPRPNPVRRPIHRSAAPPTVSGRWLLKAVGVSVAGAAVCAWLVLCLLFWQGSWQLLYHPVSAVTQTPESANLVYEPVAFATTEAGVARLKGWWIPAAPEAGVDPEYAAVTGVEHRFTVLYLHGQNGNLGDTVQALAQLHALGVNVLAFDYRGYGQSQFARPSEARWREDAEWALTYLTATRHMAAGSIVLDGQALGANLALEVAAVHPELAGVVLESPLSAPVETIFGDPRARLVPARLLVSDRWDVETAARRLLLPALWLEWAGAADKPAYASIATPKQRVWLSGPKSGQDYAAAYSAWMETLPQKR